MPDLTILISQPVELQFPSSLVGWFGWFAFLAIIILLNRRWRYLNHPLDDWHNKALVVLLLSVPLINWLLPSFYISEEGFEYYLPMFNGVSWFIAAGLFGPGIASGVAFLSGISIWLFAGDGFFLPLELAFLAACLGWMFFQGYRTPLFRGLRHPLIAAIPLIFIFPVIHMFGLLLTEQGSLAMRLASGLEQILDISTIFGGISLIAGTTSEVAATLLKSRWGANKSLLPSPAERKLSTRFLLSVVPISIFLLGILVISAWFIAARAAHQMLEDRMASAAEMTAQGIPFYLETGQNLLLDLANEPLFERSAQDVQTRLVTQRRDIPYFSQLLYLDPGGEIITSDPVGTANSSVLSREELNHVETAAFVPIDIILVAPDEGSSAALLSFIAGVKDQNGQLQGVLIGRSDLAVNPFAKPLVTSMDSLSTLGGEGMLVDENGYILYHPDPDQVMSKYQGERSGGRGFSEETSPDGSSQYVYIHPVMGRPWSVIVTVPTYFVQEWAIQIALPLLGIILVLAIMAFFIFRYGIRSLTFSLEDLAVQANQMSHGELDQALDAKGEDEVGQLRYALEHMRRSLKSRVDELNHLLIVSQGIASAFDYQQSLKRVLDSSLVEGATSARLYLLPSVIPDPDGKSPNPFRMGSGPANEDYAFLDEQICGLTEKQEIVKLNNLTRPRIFTSPPDQIPPQSLLSVSMRHENHYIGNLWIAHEKPHKFSDEEIRYLTMLAGQATLAVANAQLFLITEIGRQRLEAILNATPDPVLVTDQKDNLVLINAAAREIFNLYDESQLGKSLSEIVLQEDLTKMLQSDPDQSGSQELIFKNGKTYLATVAGVEVKHIGSGKVCVMRDVTSFEQLNSSKSDFVSTVSHDLRSPLALIQGYTSMLQMVGELNEQQTGYLKKISDETEKISHLVTNLLDLGRIEADVGLQIEKKAVDDVVDRVMAAAQVQADQKRINLVSKIDTTYLPSIEADQALLQQALYNLVDNAIKFTEPGGEVRIHLRSTEDIVTYIVEDSGIGISPADQQNLFGKFFRASSRKELETGGSGLGLAIVKSIAEKHAGRVWVDSQLGSGSTFYLELPLRQSQK